MKLEVSLTDEQLKGAVSEAVMTALSEADRRTLIQNALNHLLTPAKPQYGSRATTPLQDAFDDAISRVARKLCEERISADPEIAAQVNALIGDMVKKAFGDDSVRDKIVGGLVSKFRDLIMGW